MKPTDENCRAATKVNVFSPETVEAGGPTVFVRKLEGNTSWSVEVSSNEHPRGPRQQHGNERPASELSTHLQEQMGGKLNANRVC